MKIDKGALKQTNSVLGLVPNEQDRLKKKEIKTEISIGGSPLDGEYDPYENRRILEPTSNLETAVHLVKGNIGTGILAMPEAFKYAGLFVGSIGLAAITTLCLYAMSMLLNCSKLLCQKYRTPYLDFAQVGELAFKSGPPALRSASTGVRIWLNSFLCLMQLGFCCVYVMFVGANTQKLVYESFGISFSVPFYMTILIVPLIFLNWIRDLKHLSKFTLLGNIFMSIGLAIILYYITQDLPPMTNRNDFHPIFSHWSQIPLYLGCALFAFEGIGMILPLENTMKNPKDFAGFTGVLNRTMIGVALLYLLIGFFGYWKYGDATAGSITLNLPSKEWLAMCVRIMMTVSIYFSYPIQFYVIMSIVWPNAKEKFEFPSWTETVVEWSIRTILVLSTYALAITIPNIALFISLLGAMCSCVMGLILPPLFDVLVYWEQGYGKLKWILWKDIFLILIGMAACVTGTYVSVIDLVNNDDSG